MILFLKFELRAKLNADDLFCSDFVLTVPDKRQARLVIITSCNLTLNRGAKTGARTVSVDRTNYLEILFQNRFRESA